MVQCAHHLGRHRAAVGGSIRFGRRDGVVWRRFTMSQMSAASQRASSYRARGTSASDV
jgi:hypothetical protein